MPTSALASAFIEGGINKLLDLDEASAARLASLKGARLIVYLEPLPNAFMLVFSERVDVLSVYDSFDETVANLSPLDCCISTSMQTLPQLKETNQLTRLIQQNKLNVEGELAVAQKVSALFQQLDIDVEEIIAEKTSDVFAHQSVKTVKAVQEKASKVFAALARNLGNVIVEEKPVAAHRLAVMHFSDEVNALRDDTARLEARLKQLEYTEN